MDVFNYAENLRYTTYLFRCYKEQDIVAIRNVFNLLDILSGIKTLLIALFGLPLFM